MKKQFAEWKREFGLVEDERYVKKEEDYRSKEIKSLLFDKYINYLKNKKEEANQEDTESILKALNKEFNTNFTK